MNDLVLAASGPAVWSSERLHCRDVPWFLEIWDTGRATTSFMQQAKYSSAAYP